MTVREPTPREMERASMLYDLLADHADGMTWEAVSVRTGWDRKTVVKEVQVLRDRLDAEDDTISVPCDPDPDNPSGPWIYRLMGGIGIIDPEQTTWPSNQVDYLERRLHTAHHVVNAGVRSTDGRTMEGKKVRIWALHLKRAEEDIAMM